MNAKEIDGVFHCDCGFSWSRGKNGSHNCADGLREKVQQLAAENVGLKQSKPSLKAMMSALDAFYADEDVPESAMLIAFNILRGDIETPATDRIVAEAEARGVEKFAAEQRGVAERLQKRGVATASVPFCLDSAEEAEYFAKQLREGAK
ncbi:hypothetical protein [Klebsiella spallanzanii]|uniref:Uncharacterized protein n=1 Tax=Klebsiella spallanzanii TaxID=2587528 RepID=A0A564HWD3_9ENTR|nr:hypothetical protein [Klebsiella spallanzanii]VUS37632.1 hypothetical protein SB6408_03221 [Klebsiella spallanzanii]